MNESELFLYLGMDTIGGTYDETFRWDHCLLLIALLIEQKLHMDLTGPPPKKVYCTLYEELGQCQSSLKQAVVRNAFQVISHDYPGGYSTVFPVALSALLDSGETS